jgi:AbrB family looped-hinge helix DNA binding protein
VTVTDKGQLAVPKAIRDQFGIEPGSKLDFEPQADGTLRVRVLPEGAAAFMVFCTGRERKPRRSTRWIGASARQLR